MSTISIKNYNVKFPYENAYDLQKVYMEKVITCLDEGRHGVLESPTGTGKTLCLFAPLTTWMTSKKIEEDLLNRKSNCDKGGCDNSDTNKCGNLRTKKTRIWYTSRTHAQITQAGAEIKKCNIKDLNLTVIGSRDQLCINKKVQIEEPFYVKSLKCRELTKKIPSRCEFFKKDNFLVHRDQFFKKGEMKDIEDLITTGKECNVCPYYMSQNSWEESDIILLPYNYILDVVSREASSFDFQDSVIIFDEGHNVPTKCEESFEFQLSTDDLILGLKSVRLLWENLDNRCNKGNFKSNDEKRLIEEHLQNFNLIRTILHTLKDLLTELPFKNKELLSLSTLYNFFDKAGITKQTALNIRSAIGAFKSDSEYLKLNNSALTIFNLLEKMMNCLYDGSILDFFDEKTIDLSFKCAITEDDWNKSNKKLSLFCFNPSFGIQALLRLDPKCIIITSGTLSPLDAFIHELSLPDPVTLENPHIAKRSQVPFMILGQGVKNQPMVGSYKRRFQLDYMISLGLSLTNLIRSVPDGVLLLFSSYKMMQELKRIWESHYGIWNQFNSMKRVFMESHGKDNFIECIENFRRAVDSGNGAILMGVLRGKISEGMDFKDQYCRAVFIIAVPYPPVGDPKIKGKNEFAQLYRFFNPKTNREERLYESYSLVEAMKTTNQAIGRVIRHSRDYGAVILVDRRFTERQLFFKLSSWIRGSKPVAKNYSETKKLLVKFFKDVHTGKLGVPEIRCQRVNDNGCPIAEVIYYEKFDIRRNERTPSASSTLAVDPVNKNKSQSIIIDENDNNNNNGASEGPNLSINMDVRKNLTPLFDKLDDSANTSIGFSGLDLSDHLEIASSSPSKRKLLLHENNGQILKSPRKEKR